MSDDSLLGQLAEEFTRRVREGKLPDIEEYASRYPELAGRIRELFPTLMLLEGMAATSDSVTADTLPSGLSPGSVFGQYRIEREIGRGGMGIVYEATHLLLEKRVALKMLPVRTPVDAAHLERFFREARTAAGLHHTNIVPVFDVGQIGGTSYYAMQYIEGRGLDRVLKLVQSPGEQDASADAASTDFTGDRPPESSAASVAETTAREKKGPGLQADPIPPDGSVPACLHGRRITSAGLRRSESRRRKGLPMPTSARWCTAISSPRTCCWTTGECSGSQTSGWQGESRIPQ